MTSAAGTDLRRSHRLGNYLDPKISDFGHALLLSLWLDREPHRRSVEEAGIPTPPGEHDWGVSLLFQLHHPDVALLQCLARKQRRAIFRQAPTFRASQFRKCCERHLACIQVEDADTLFFEEEQMPAVREPLWRGTAVRQ